MRITFLCLLFTFMTEFVTSNVANRNADIRLPVHRPDGLDDKSPENVNVLLATLFEMHHNLIAQISILEDKLKSPLPTTEATEIKHLVEHYTAQKNNIEIGIIQIQSNESGEGSGARVAEGRHISKDSSTDSKSIPLILNLFRRNQTPEPETAKPSQPHLELQQPSYSQQQVYQQNDLIQSTFPGLDSQQNIIYVTDDQAPQQFSQPQQILVQPQPQSEPQYQFEQTFSPPKLPVRGPQVPEFDSQRYQQQGQKEGIFVYYPNGMITDDNERPSIANRFGQAFDRFGQAVYNFGYRQPLNNNQANDGQIYLQRSESSMAGKSDSKIKGNR